jgi:hypothetical protein
MYIADRFCPFLMLSIKHAGGTITEPDARRAACLGEKCMLFVKNEEEEKGRCGLVPAVK